MDTNKNTFEVREIDAWMDTNETWIYNTSYLIGYFTTNAKDEKRAFTKFLKNNGIVFYKGKTNIDVQDGGCIMEIQNRKTKEPLYAAIYREN